jgi:hypothetical protein
MSNLSFAEVENVNACASAATAVGIVIGVGLVILACD